MAKFKFTPLAIPEVIMIEPTVFSDSRGFFTETYNKKEFADAGIFEDFIQDNHSYSTKGVVRGLHFSLPPHETAKLVRCVEGEVLDVAVDIRANSKTFGKWVAEKLSRENGKMLFVPKGFAHGYCVLSETSSFLYKVSEYYYPESDRGILWNDSDLAIDWGVENPILSEKDSKLPTFKDLSK